MTPWRRGLALFGLLLGSIAAAVPGAAHEIRPALLEIEERSPGWFDVTWKVPTRGERILPIRPVLPGGLEALGPATVRSVPGASIERSSWRGRPDDWVGHEIAIEGLSALRTDVLLRIELLDGTRHSAILRPGAPVYRVPERASRAEVAGSYWRMGVIHILEGVDHLLFLLALMWIVDGLWRLLQTVTAFTVAHSITLGLATLGWVNVPAAPTEAVISLSILFLAAEIARDDGGRGSVTHRRPWLVALAFGLFHGLGFAGALSEVGVPAHEVPLALLMFNVGVETGQVAFVAVVAGVLAVGRRLELPSSGIAPRLVPYTIGSLAAFWTIQRTVDAFEGVA